MQLTVNHVGITVTDLDRSTEFYTAFGGEVMIGGRFAGPDMDRGLGLPEVSMQVRMIRFDGFVLELLQYDSPASEPYALRNSSAGATHVAFGVADLHALYEELSERGVEFVSEPIPIEDGPYHGGYWVYAKDPDGISVEFLQPGPEFAKTLG
jgi:catechol 2,3-dioxygenase-like lactoylglutathione lyase family enzyme